MNSEWKLGSNKRDDPADPSAQDVAGKWNRAGHPFIKVAGSPL
jgi:hypothetical protein